MGLWDEGVAVDHGWSQEAGVEVKCRRDSPCGT
jgi:hypothetical protein